MKKVGIVCCSNGQNITYKADIDKLINILTNKGIEPCLSNYIYSGKSVEAGSPLERAKALNCFYKDDAIEEIYDISGGDIANEILPYLDYDAIKMNNKPFYGYSDLTTVINCIYTMTGNTSVLFQVKNLVWDKTGKQETVFDSEEMYKFNYEYIQGNTMKGVVVGGNIRCFLKLAGTKYFPEMPGKLLLLEAYSGMQPQLATYFAQLSQMGVFDKVNGVILGTFSEMGSKGIEHEVVDIAKKYIGENVPIVKTYDIGHQPDSKAIVIGKEYLL